MNIRSIKQNARHLLIGRYGILIAASLLFETLVILVNNLFTATSSLSLVIFSIVITLLAGILEAGLYRLYLKAAAGEKIVLTDFFYCFKNAPDRYILLALILLVLNTVLTLPFSALLPDWAAYWMMPFPFYLHAVHQALSIPVRVFLTVLWCIIAVFIYLHFILMYLIAATEETLSVTEVISRSISMMKGNILFFAKLQLSFLGIMFLGILSFGIGFVWLIPYIRMTTVCFYLELLPKKEDAGSVFEEEQFITEAPAED